MLWQTVTCANQLLPRLEKEWNGILLWRHSVCSHSELSARVIFKESDILLITADWMLPQNEKNIGFWQCLVCNGKHISWRYIAKPILAGLIRDTYYCQTTMHKIRSYLQCMWLRNSIDLLINEALKQFAVFQWTRKERNVVQSTIICPTNSFG